MRFEIVVRGQLSAAWAEAFDGLQVDCQPDGDSRLSGDFPDQAALYGLLLRLRDLGLTLVSLNPAILPGEESAFQKDILKDEPK